MMIMQYTFHAVGSIIIFTYFVEVWEIKVLCMNYDDEGLEEYPSEGEREMEKKKVWGKEIEKGNSERERKTSIL